MLFKKLFGDISSAMLLIISIALIVFLGITSINIVDRINTFNTPEKVGSYSQIYQLNVSESTYQRDDDNVMMDIEDLDKNMIDEYINIVSDRTRHASVSMSVCYGNLDILCDYNIMLSDDIEGEIYNLVGERIKVSDSNVAVIGRKLENDVRNGYIQLGINKYKVVGIVDISEPIAFTFLNNMSPKVLKKTYEEIYEYVYEYCCTNMPYIPVINIFQAENEHSDEIQDLRHELDKME